MKLKQTMPMLLGLLAISLPVSASPIMTFTLSPLDGVRAGQAGTAVGWGYTIDNSGSDFVTIQSFFFAELTPIGIFSAPVIPGTAASAGTPIASGPFVANSSGLQYDIFASAALGASTQGVMTLYYDTYSDAGLTNQIGFGDTVNATTGRFNLNGDPIAEVDVDAPATGTVPEPGSTALIGIGCALLAVWGCLTGLGAKPLPYGRGSVTLCKYVANQSEPRP